MTYCVIIWGCAASTILQQIIVLQDRALRVIAGLKFGESTVTVFQQLSLLKYTDIYKFHIMLFMFKYIKHVLPRSCMHYFDPNTVHSYGFRSANMFRLYSHRTCIRERTLH